MHATLSSPCSDSLSLRLRSAKTFTSPRTLSRRFMMRKVRNRAFTCGHSAFPACRHTISGSFDSPPGFFSPFPRGTGSLSVDREYLGLRDGPRRFRQDCTCPALLGNSARLKNRFGYGALTLCGPPFQTARLQLFSPKCGPTTPAEFPRTVWPLPRSLATTSGIEFSFFSSRY